MPIVVVDQALPARHEHFERWHRFTTNVSSNSYRCRVTDIERRRGDPSGIRTSG